MITNLAITALTCQITNNVQYKITWIENKTPDWRVANVTDLAGVETKDVSVNRVNKKGEVFPNWEGVTLEATIEADLWVSTAGKAYLFAPRPQNAPTGGGFRAQQMEKAVARKESFIEKTVNEKEEGIRTSSTARDATLITLEFMKSEGGWSQDQFWENWERTRKKLLANWTPEPF